MEVIRHAELIVWNGSFGQLSTPTVHLIIQSNVLPITGFVRHTLYICLTKVCSIVQRNHSILFIGVLCRILQHS